MSYKARKTLFIFLDEAGNLDFSATGTKYWSLTALCTLEPVLGREEFAHLLYDLADRGLGQEYFHATEDQQHVRDSVFGIITGLKDEFEIHSIIAEKRKAHPSLYRKWVTRKGKKINVKDETRFYQLICGYLLRYIFERKRYANAERIVVVLSSLFDNAKHSTICGILKIQLRAHTRVPFEIYFHQTKADMNCQIADYCGWGITIKWERGEDRSYKLIRSRIKSEFPVFQNGYKDHY